MVSVTSQFQSVLSPGSRSRAMAVFPSVVARVFNFINRAVRQDAPESLDHYFVDFAKATPIVSVVFGAVRFHGSQTSHGDDFCFTQKTKRSTGVRTL